MSVMSQVRGRPTFSPSFFTFSGRQPDSTTVSMSDHSHSSITALIPPGLAASVALSGNDMDANERKKLIRSARKLSRVLGEPLTLCEEVVPELPRVSTTIRRSRSMKSRHLVDADESLPILHSKVSKPFRSTSFHSAPSSPRSRNLPALKVDCNFAIKKLQEDAMLMASSPTTSSPIDSLSATLTPSPIEVDVMEVRRVRMAKLVRHLGENVPAELVFPTLSSPAPQSKSALDHDFKTVKGRRSSWALSLKRMKSTSSLRSLDNASTTSSPVEPEITIPSYLNWTDVDVTPRAPIFRIPKIESDREVNLIRSNGASIERLQSTLREHALLVNSSRNYSNMSLHGQYRGSLDSSSYSLRSSGNPSSAADIPPLPKKSNAVQNLPLMTSTSSSSEPSTPTPGTPLPFQQYASQIITSPHLDSRFPNFTDTPSPDLNFTFGNDINNPHDGAAFHARRAAKLSKFFGVTSDDMSDMMLMSTQTARRAHTPPPSTTTRPVDTSVTVRVEAGGLLAKTKARHRATLTHTGGEEMREMIGRLREMKAH